MKTVLPQPGNDLKWVDWDRLKEILPDYHNYINAIRQLKSPNEEVVPYYHVYTCPFKELPMLLGIGAPIIDGIVQYRLEVGI